MEILKCPYCNEALIYVSDGGYTSGYENNGYKMSCMCHFAWQNTDWKPIREEAIKMWNDKVNEVKKIEKRNIPNANKQGHEGRP